jgi:hypothetical protein
MSSEPRTWEQVLAEVERDAERAAALLAAPPEDALPYLDAVPTLMPALAGMPPVPGHLRERIETLRDQIDALSAELAEALRNWPPRLPVSAVAASARSEPSRYIDRRL